MNWPVKAPAGSSEPPAKKMRMWTGEDSMERTGMSSKAVSKGGSHLSSAVPISPPISPEQKLQGGPVTVIRAHRNSEDPILYPGNSTIEESERRLFLISPQVPPGATKGKVDANIESNAKANGATMQQNYQVQAARPFSFRSHINHLYNRNSAELLKYLRKESQSKIPQRSNVRDVLQTVHPRNSSQRDRVFQKASDNRRVMSVSPAVNRGAVSNISQISNGKSPSLKRARPVDDDFQSVPDYCPPITALTRPEALCAKWTAGAIDLSLDPNRHLLDSREIRLASVLRLTCAQYLTGKRRIFQGKVLSLRRNRMFRKTDAQQVCKIDVNKASMLWKAFDEGGWFKRDLFDHHSAEE